MSVSPLLQLSDLHVRVGEAEVLRGVDLTLLPGQTSVLLGPNGAGKSSLGGTIAGLARYQVTQGELRWSGESIAGWPPEQRARAGIFLTWQNPVAIPGVRVADFLRQASEAVSAQYETLWDFRQRLQRLLTALELPGAVLERDFGVGFSGGEKKKLELLQLLLLQPRLAILDELDSGLDADAVRVVRENVRAYQREHETSFLIITHTAAILEGLSIDTAHVLDHGQIAATGDSELVARVKAEGYAWLRQEGSDDHPDA